MVEKLNIYQKIQLVSNEVRNVEKDIQVGSGNYGYKAVSDLAVTLAIKDAETKHGIISIPIKQELVNSEVITTIKKNGDEGRTFVDTIKMTIVIVNLDDPKEEIFVESFGKGVDSGDKGFGKASTYARKYALLNAYKIATGEDPDANKSEEIKSPSTPDEKRVMITNYLDNNLETLQKLLQHFNVGTLDDMTDKQVNTVYSTYKQKGLI